MSSTRRKSPLNSTADAQRLFSEAAAAKFMRERGEEKQVPSAFCFSEAAAAAKFRRKRGFLEITSTHAASK